MPYSKRVPCGCPLGAARPPLASASNTYSEQLNLHWATDRPYFTKPHNYPFIISISTADEETKMQES